MQKTLRPSWQLIISCSLGTFLEFFDYTLYAYFAVLISQQFFPNHSAQIQWVATWSVFAIGCLVRPLGAIPIRFFACAKSDKFDIAQVKSGNYTCGESHNSDIAQVELRCYTCGESEKSDITQVGRELNHE